MVNRQEGETNSPQHLRDLREDPAFDPRSGYLHWRLAGANCGAVPVARGCALCRASLFLPATALVPPALGALIFKLVDRLQQAGHMTGLVSPPERNDRDLSSTFILAYLIVCDSAASRSSKWRKASCGNSPL